MNEILLDKSRLYRPGSDEDLYRCNILFDQMRELATLARIIAADAVRDVHLSQAAKSPEMARFYAFFSGSAARRAFSVAQRVLDLNEERFRVCGTAIDFAKW
jgi:hypothetical protein